MEIIVRAGDTLWHYSRLFDLPLLLIQKSNPSVDPNLLTVGQSIQIPGYVTQKYSIKTNDSLWKIGANSNVSLEMLFLVNTQLDPNNLQIGQSIDIPKRVEDMIVMDVDMYTYDKMNRDLERLLNVYPFLINQTIGQSIMGKNIDEIQIGTGNKQVHVNGSFHANEWITTPVIMRFLNEYVLSVTNGTSIRGLDPLPLYMNTLLSIVPMVNPDGVDLVIEGLEAAGEHQERVLAINNQSEDFSDWKANIRGVDLNNQYPAGWEIEAARKPNTPQPRDYPGTAPLTEPEAIAMAELAQNQIFSRVNALHTQGEVIYWGFEGLEPPISESIVNEYARVSGYTPIRYVDSYAGYKDWFIQRFRRPGFTIELGSGTNPLPIEQFPEIYEESLGILLANLYL